MLHNYKLFIPVALFSSLMACSKVDDYLLGKDNTPQPAELQPVTSKVNVAEKWSVPVGAPSKAVSYLKLKPVVQKGIIYTADASGMIQAVEQDSGKLVWAKKISEGIVSGPTVSQQHVIVSTDSSKLIALNTDNGHELWQTKLSSEVLSLPVVAQNKVIAKTVDGNLYAFNLANGEQQWLSEHGAPNLILKASSSPVVVNNELILVGYSDGRMDAVDLKTGQVAWQRSIAYAAGPSDVERLVDIDADPIVQGKTIFLGSYQGYIGALSVETGEFIWRKPASIYKNMVLKGDTLYLTDSNDVVWAINKNTGSVNWKQVGLKARGLTEPVILDKQLVVGDRTGMLHILSTQNGEFISRTSLGSAIISAPSVVGNNLYVMTANGKLSRFSVG